jgi:hypothetical protein
MQFTLSSFLNAQSQKNKATPKNKRGQKAFAMTGLANADRSRKWGGAVPRTDPSQAMMGLYQAAKIA